MVKNEAESYIIFWKLPLAQLQKFTDIVSDKTEFPTFTGIDTVIMWKADMKMTEDGARSPDTECVVSSMYCMHAC